MYFQCEQVEIVLQLSPILMYKKNLIKIEDLNLCRKNQLFSIIYRLILAKLRYY